MMLFIFMYFVGAYISYYLAFLGVYGFLRARTVFLLWKNTVIFLVFMVLSRFVPFFKKKGDKEQSSI